MVLLMLQLLRRNPGQEVLKKSHSLSFQKLMLGVRVFNIEGYFFLLLQSAAQPGLF